MLTKQVLVIRILIYTILRFYIYKLLQKKNKDICKIKKKLMLIRLDYIRYYSLLMHTHSLVYTRYNYHVISQTS